MKGAFSFVLVEQGRSRISKVIEDTGVGGLKEVDIILKTFLSGVGLVQPLLNLLHPGLVVTVRLEGGGQGGAPMCYAGGIRGASMCYAGGTTVLCRGHHCVMQGASGGINVLCRGHQGGINVLCRGHQGAPLCYAGGIRGAPMCYAGGIRGAPMCYAGVIGGHQCVMQGASGGHKRHQGDT